LVAMLGAVMVIEMLYHLTLESVNGSEMKLFGFMVDTAAPSGWIAAAVLLAIGGLGFWRAKKAFNQVWGEVSTEIEDMIRRAQA
jgi:branched-chain amino acid transport system permease protein